jgi:hypothetical protein
MLSSFVTSSPLTLNGSRHVDLAPVDPPLHGRGAGRYGPGPIERVRVGRFGCAPKGSVGFAEHVLGKVNGHRHAGQILHLRVLVRLPAKRRPAFAREFYGDRAAPDEVGDGETDVVVISSIRPSGSVPIANPPMLAPCRNRNI